MPFAWQAYAGSNEWWRPLLTVVFVIAASCISNVPLIGVLASSAPVRQRGLDVNNFTPEALGVDPALFLALLLFPFVIGLLTLWYCVRYIHRRDPMTLMYGRRATLRKKRIGLAFVSWILLSAASELFSFWLTPDVYAFTFIVWSFAKTLVVVALRFLL